MTGVAANSMGPGSRSRYPRARTADACITEFVEKTRCMAHPQTLRLLRCYIRLEGLVRLEKQHASVSFGPVRCWTVNPHRWTVRQVVSFNTLAYLSCFEHIFGDQTWNRACTTCFEGPVMPFQAFHLADIRFSIRQLRKSPG